MEIDELLTKISGFILNVQVAVDKAKAASNVLTSMYFTNSEPRATLLEASYNDASELAYIRADYLDELGAEVQKMADFAEGKETA